MKDLLNNANFMALVGTLFGGAGIKALEQWLGRAKEKADQGVQIRDELRKEIESLRTQMTNASAEEQRLETEVDAWRTKYYDLRDEKQKVVTELTITLERLKSLEAKIAEQMTKPDPT